MNISKLNASVRPFLVDDDFKRDKNPHKYVLLWSTKFYRLINNIMRAFPLEIVLRETKYTKYYVIKLVKYFIKHGVSKKEVMERSPLLYRGLDKDFKIVNEYTEKGFMSTSMSLSIAEEFKGKHDGCILTFSTKKLPPNTPFLLIDESIAEHLAEQEVLFLPGKITLKKSSKDIKAVYEMDRFILEIVKEKQDGGGAVTRELINLKGRYIVWWRAIKGRPVEIVGMMEMPKKSNEVEKFFKNVILPYDDGFAYKNDFIPQFKDLKEKFFQLGTLEKDERELYESYFVNMAIYDSKNKKVLTINYGVFDEMFNEEMFDNNRSPEVHEAIIKHCGWL